MATFWFGRYRSYSYGIYQCTRRVLVIGLSGSPRGSGSLGRTTKTQAAMPAFTFGPPHPGMTGDTTSPRPGALGLQGVQEAPVTRVDSDAFTSTRASLPAYSDIEWSASGDVVELYVTVQYSSSI